MSEHNVLAAVIGIEYLILGLLVISFSNIFKTNMNWSQLNLKYLLNLLSSFNKCFSMRMLKTPPAFLAKNNLFILCLLNNSML